MAFGRPLDAPESNFFKQQYLFSAISITNALGSLSPLARDCYVSYEGFHLLWLGFLIQVDQFSTFAAIVQMNVIDVFQDLNDFGWLTYKAQRKADWRYVAFGWSRITYLILFRTITPADPDRILTSIYP